MLDYSEATAKILENVNTLEAEEKPLLKSAGQILAEDVYSGYDVPLTKTSAMDGYAIRAEDIQNASPDNPVTLHVIETVIAGYLPKRSVTSGTAIRIMTGAAVPSGADCVIRFEDTDESEANKASKGESLSEVHIYASVVSGRNIRQIGENINQGSLVLAKGTRMGPAEIAVLTSIGKARVRVIRRPVLAIMASGEELINLSEPLPPGKSYDSNTAAIAALVNHYGGIPKILGVARDNEKSILAKLKKGMTADAIISSGGVSQGDFDLVRDIIGQNGQVLFSGVRISPGKPFSFGMIERVPQGDLSQLIPFFALAGNPTACLLNFELFARPAILKMRGYRELNRPKVQARMKEPVINKKTANSFLWVKLERKDEKYLASLAGDQKRGVLISVTKADGLAIIPENSIVSKDEIVDVMPLHWHGEPFLQA
ncbi:MAG: molybdopterin molybdotransferase MoeA [Dehalococcoidales bacterium]|nr:molybdopterin molybdotransferase MoeA [Dehalococcoidales bacterium]